MCQQSRKKRKKKSKREENSHVLCTPQMTLHDKLTVPKEGTNCTFRHFLHRNAMTLGSETTWMQKVWTKQALFFCIPSDQCNIGACLHEVKGMFSGHTGQTHCLKFLLQRKDYKESPNFHRHLYPMITWRMVGLLPHFCSSTAEEEEEEENSPCPLTTAGRKCTKTM